MQRQRELQKKATLTNNEQLDLRFYTPENFEPQPHQQHSSIPQKTKYETQKVIVEEVQKTPAQRAIDSADKLARMDLSITMNENRDDADAIDGQGTTVAKDSTKLVNEFLTTLQKDKRRSCLKNFDPREHQMH